MILGWKELYVDKEYNFSEEPGIFIASCFILFNIVIWVGKVKKVSDTDE